MRPKIFHRTLQLDRGGEAALVWGRRECERLASLGNKAFNRSVYIGDFLVRLRGEQFSDGHYVTRIWVESAAIVNRLHTWPVTTALKNFTLQALPTDPQQLSAVAPSTIIGATGLDALGGVLSFSLVDSAASVGASYGVSWPTSKILRDFTMLAATKKWMLRQWLAEAITGIYVNRVAGDPGEQDTPPGIPAALTSDQFAQLSPGEQQDFQTALEYWRPPLTITNADCMISEPVNGDCMVLLGQFRNPPGSVLPDGTVNPDTLQYFRGIVAPLSTLIALNASQTGGLVVDVSNFNTSITPQQRGTIRVLQPTDYRRSQPFQFYFGPSGHIDNFLSEASYQQTAASPFVVTYVTQKAIQVMGDNPAIFPQDNVEQFINYVEQHRLDGAGNIHVTQYDTSAFEGSSSVVDDSTSPPSISFVRSPVACAMSFYTGEELERIGDFDFTGTSLATGQPDVNGTLTWKVAVPFATLPLPNVDPRAIYVDEYLPEFGIIRSASDVVANLDSRDFVLNVPLDAGSISNFGSLVVPGPQNVRIIETGGGVAGAFESVVGTGYGLTNGDVFSNYAGQLAPRQSGLPIGQSYGAATLGGSVFWYRDGPTGVFIYNVAAVDFFNHSEDCDKYQNVFTNQPGYRVITNSDGSQVTEAHYEPLEVILARIVAVVNVVLNNFASPAFYPWVKPAGGNAPYIGIII